MANTNITGYLRTIGRLHEVEVALIRWRTARAVYMKVANETTSPDIIDDADSQAQAAKESYRALLAECGLRRKLEADQNFTVPMPAGARPELRQYFEEICDNLVLVE